MTVIWMVPESARKLIVLGRTCTPWAAASMDPSTAPRSCVQAWEPPRHRAEVSCWIAAVQARAPGASAGRMRRNPLTVARSDSSSSTAGPSSGEAGREGSVVVATLWLPWIPCLA